MTDYLLFSLYGPMAAWGDTAVGEFRPSHPHPTRTGVLGLVAAALGIRSHEEERLQQLDRSCRVAIRLDAPGELLRDYHTVQAPPQAALKGHWVQTRKDEVAALERYWRKNNKTAQASPISLRDYRTDSAATIALSLRDEAEIEITLATMQQALQRPALPLYLGRKSCPLALPLQPRIIQADTLRAAFAAMADPLGLIRQITHGLQNHGDGIAKPELIRFYWEEDQPDPGMQPDTIYPRRDRLRSRKRWQFDTRNEHSASQVTEETP